MAGKKSFVLRIDEDIFKTLEKWAEDDFRSVNGQIEWLIHQKLKETGRLKSTLPSQSKATVKKGSANK